MPQPILSMSVNILPFPNLNPTDVIGSECHSHQIPTVGCRSFNTSPSAHISSHAYTTSARDYEVLSPSAHAHSYTTSARDYEVFSLTDFATTSKTHLISPANIMRVCFSPFANLNLANVIVSECHYHQMSDGVTSCVVSKISLGGEVAVGCCVKMGKRGRSRKYQIQAKWLIGIYNPPSQSTLKSTLNGAS